MEQNNQFYSKKEFVKSTINVWDEHLTSDFPVHYHDFSELVIITGGKAVHIIDDMQYTIQSGDVYVIKGNTAHGFSQVRNLSLFNIAYMENEPVLEYDFLRIMSGFQALFFVEPVYRKQLNFEHKLHLSYKDMSFAESILGIMAAQNTENPEHERILRIHFTSFIAFLSQQFEQKTKNSKIVSISDTLAFIEKNYTQQITIDELAEMAYLSSRHFTRLFIQNYGITPKQYIVQLRIRYACSRLEQSAKNISDIALESGFTDTNYFTSCFKKRMGASPKEYRTGFRNNH